MIPEQAAGRWLKRALVCVAGLVLLAGGPARAADDSEQQLTDALRSMGKGDWQWAKRTVDRLGNRQLSLYARWRELLESADKPSFRTYAAFLREHPDWPSLGTIQARAEEQIDEAVEPRGAAGLLRASRSPARARAGSATPRPCSAPASGTRRSRVLRRTWAEDDVPLAEERYFLGLYGDHLRPEDHEARLDRLLWDREISAAQRMLPFTRAERDTVAVARIRLQGLEKKAEATVAGLPKGARVDPGVLYDEVRFYRRRGKHAQANALLARSPADLVRPELWWSEQNTAIRELIDDGEFAAAYRIARAHRQDDGTAFAEGEWLAGWLALRFLKQPADAAKHFERLWEGVSSPISRGRAGYWAGRAHEAAGSKAGGARVVWPCRPLSRRASTASSRRRSWTSTWAPCWRRGRGPRPRPRSSSAGASPPPWRAHSVTLGDRSLAQPFFRHLGHTAARNADALRAVVELGEECRRPDLMVIATKAAVREGGSDADPHGRLPDPGAAQSPHPRRGAGRATLAPGRGPPGEPVRSARREPGRCPGADAAHAGDGPGDGGPAEAALLEAAAHPRPRVQREDRQLLPPPAAGPVRRRAGPGTGRLQCRARAG